MGGFLEDEEIIGSSKGHRGERREKGSGGEVRNDGYQLAFRGMSEWRGDLMALLSSKGGRVR